MSRQFLFANSLSEAHQLSYSARPLQKNSCIGQLCKQIITIHIDVFSGDDLE